MSFEPITRWVLRCDGATTRGQCPEQLWWTDHEGPDDHDDEDEDEDFDGDDPDQPCRWIAVLDEPALPADWKRPLRDRGWLHTAGRVLCPRHVAALEYLAHAELDGLPFPTGVVGPSAEQ